MYMVLHGLGLHLGDVLPLLVIFLTGMAPFKQVVGMHHVSPVQ